LPDHSRWLLRLLCFVMLLLAACACYAQEPQEASSSYKAKKDYASLAVLVKHLRKGMARTEVEALLGEADYSPIEGQEYYSSDRSEFVPKTDTKQTVGLVVEYRDEQGRLTAQLQQFELGLIGE
jgi:hypothetical protein